MYLGEPIDGPITKPVKSFNQKYYKIKPRGKKTIEYEKWRDTVAKPYLDDKYGHFCRHCSTPLDLQVDHVLGRGSHPELKMVLDNLQWLCPSCHSQKTTHNGV